MAAGQQNDVYTWIKYLNQSTWFASACMRMRLCGRGRCMAECFLLLVLEKNEAAEYGLLGDMIHALPDEVSWLPTRDVEYEDIRAVAAELGIGFSSKTIWDDLKTLQWYGNRAAHARGYVDHGPMGPDDGVFVAAVRVVVWHSKLQRHTTHYNTGQYITA